MFQKKINMGIMDNIYILKSLLTHVLNQNKKLYCACVDFTKAFDFVNQDTVWYKLVRIWIRGKMLDITKSMTKEVKSQVKHNYMSRVMRKPTFCICENKDADQLPGNREADQRLCFRYTESTIPLLPKSVILSL